MTARTKLSYALMPLVLVGRLALSQDAPPPDGSEGAPPKPEVNRDEVGGYDGYKDLDGHDEAYWSSKVGAARARLGALKAELARLDSNESALQSKFYNAAGPGEQTKAKEAWDDTLNRRATIRSEIEKLEEDLVNMERDGRRAGALPGWFRETREQERQREELENRAPSEGHQMVDLDKLAEDNKAADEALYPKPKKEEGKEGGDAASGAEGANPDESAEGGEKPPEEPPMERPEGDEKPPEGIDNPR
ncbi:MAG: hypothetical protein U0166_19860 [Acidobacteriota bacterium]